MNRRNFLKTTLAISSLTASGQLPFLGAEGGNGSGIDLPGEPYPVKTIGDYLSKHKLAEGQRDPGSYTLVYDIVHWLHQAKKRGKPDSSAKGTLTISRKAEMDKILFSVVEKVGSPNHHALLEAEIRCNNDQLATLDSWSVHSRYVGGDDWMDALSGMREEGKVRDGKIACGDGAFRRRFSAKNSVVCQWTLLDFLMRNPDLEYDIAFDYLRNLSLFMPDHRLGPDGAFDVPIKNGETITLNSFVQTGQGILPTHFLFDENGLPQLVTQSLVSWALKEIR